MTDYIGYKGIADVIAYFLQGVEKEKYTEKILDVIQNTMVYLAEASHEDYTNIILDEFLKSGLRNLKNWIDILDNTEKNVILSFAYIDQEKIEKAFHKKEPQE